MEKMKRAYEKQLSELAHEGETHREKGEQKDEKLEESRKEKEENEKKLQAELQLLESKNQDLTNEIKMMQLELKEEVTFKVTITGTNAIEHYLIPINI